MLRKHAGGASIAITRAAMDRLTAFAWPGNVRQLENEVRRALVLATAPSIPAPLTGDHRSARKDIGLNVREHVNTLEAELVRQALEVPWKPDACRQALGLSRFGLQKMMKRLGIRTSAQIEAD